MSDKVYLVALAVRAWMVLLIFVTSTATTPPPPQVNVTQLCNAVSGQLTLIYPTPSVKYQYQEIMRKAAGVAETDTPDVVRSKMQQYWMANRNTLRCNQLGFSVRDGNLVTLVIERDSRAAFNDFVRRWRLDLNFIDPATGMTMLDFVEAEINRTRGRPDEVQNRVYRDILISNGAKRRDEL